MINFERDLANFNLSYYCPKCKQQVRGVPKTDPKWEGGGLSEQWVHLIVQCPTQYCRLSFITYDTLNNRVARVFPEPQTSPDDYHESIPENIRKDFAEAKRCYFADAYKGTVVMCRRVVQLVVRDKISDKTVWEMKLHKQIDELLKAGLITKSLHELSTEIRHFGNFGAHPQDDGLDNITPEDAETIETFTGDLLVDLYVRPSKTAEMTKKRTKSV